jgi:holin-like protein
MDVMRTMLLLVAFQLLGEFMHRVLLIPLSGPLLGLVLFFIVLITSGGPSTTLEATTRPLLACLALLFVPAGVGVIAHLDLLREFWLPILAATLGGTVASLLATAGTLIVVSRFTSAATIRPLEGGAVDRQTKGDSA